MEAVVKKSAQSAATASPAKQIAGFISKFDPEVARVIRSARVTLRKRFPTAIEQVYDNYNFLAIGFCTTERTSDCIVSLAAQAKGVALSFYYGASLPDPRGILQGSGNQNRFIRLESAATLANPDVQTLIAAAVGAGQIAAASLGRRLHTYQVHFGQAAATAVFRRNRYAFEAFGRP
jgi:hypothetical protein